MMLNVDHYGLLVEMDKGMDQPKCESVVMVQKHQFVVAFE